MSLELDEAKSSAIAVAPRVSLDSMKAKIKYRFDILARDAITPYVSPGELDTLSMCILVMENGFVLIGKAAPASPANFNRQLGIEFAYEDAVRQLWPLEGYALRDRLQLTPAVHHEDSP